MGSSLVPPFGTDGTILGPWLTDYKDIVIGFQPEHGLFWTYMYSRVLGLILGIFHGLFIRNMGI